MRRAKRALNRVLRARAYVPIASAVLLALLAASGVGLLAKLGQWPPAFHSARSSIVITGPGAATPVPLRATILGAVYSPGSYTLASGSRVKDLVEAAGGAQANADLSRIDLASPLSDGQAIYVPSVGETTPLLVGGRININVATADQLHAALGITITEARRIVSYRQRHGRFYAVSDLLLIPISQAIYDRIKDLVTV